VCASARRHRLAPRSPREPLGRLSLTRKPRSSNGASRRRWHLPPTPPSGSGSLSARQE
jgi:hypothetical protein